MDDHIDSRSVGSPEQDIAGLLAERDARIAQLETAVLALHGEQGATKDAAACIAGTSTALADLERRLQQQEDTLRHVLTMLIEWVEDAPARADAA